MKKVININFQGRIIPIEETAHEILKQYTDSLTRFFANEEGREEIINDIEGRIAELFAETLKKGNTCISDEDVNKIINSIGRPEDFETEEVNVKEKLENNDTSDSKQQQQSHYANFTTHAGKKMFRYENDKIFGGVCSGIANYFGTDATIIRILTAIFFGVTFLPYLILWVVIPSSSTKEIGSVRKRLFRNTDEKIIAGVCSGLSHYFGVNVWVPRLLFLLPFLSIALHLSSLSFDTFPSFVRFSVSPGSIVIYVIFWLVLPEAITTAEKLEMKGEKVDLNSIKNTIQNDMEGFGKRMQQWGNEASGKAKEFSTTASQKAHEFTQETHQNIKKDKSGLGNLIITIFKVFAYSIIGIVTIFLLLGLLTCGIILTGLLPAKDYLIKDGWQNLFAWGTLIFFIWTPIIGAIAFIIRRITKAKNNSNTIRYTFIGLWVTGWICFISFIASLSQDFRFGNNPIEQNLPLTNPTIQSLEISTSTFDKYYYQHWLDFSPFGNFGEDTAYVKNYRIRIVKSNNDSFQIKMVKMSNGVSKKEADDLANKIDFQITQQDSVLKLSKGLPINKKEKFRNQHVIITLAVPVGKRFKVRGETYWNNNTRVSIGWNNEDWNDFHGSFYRDAEAYSYSSDVEYMMTTNGLKKIKNNSNDEKDKDDEDENKLEKYKSSREELRQQIEEEKRNIEEKQKQLREKQEEYNKDIDSTIKKNTTSTSVNETNQYLGNIISAKFLL